MPVPFAEFAPDLPPLGGTTDHVKNVIASSRGIYIPIKTPVASGSALTARCQGAVSFIGSDGTIVTFAGDAGNLYLWDGSAWDDVSKAATTYATPSAGQWSWSQFGDIVIADNGVDPAQKWEIGTSSAFADLGGSPPVARYSKTIREFSFRGALANDLTAVHWSSQFDPEEWTAGTNQGDTQSFPTGGRVTGLAGSQYVLVFQETEIKLGQYVGPDLIFQFDTVSVGRGCIAPGSLAEVQQTVFFLDNDGFYRIDGGQQITPIGDGKVDEYFWRTVNRSFLYRISSAVDVRRKLYIVSFPTQNSADGTPDQTLFYNYQSGWWSLGDFGGDALSLLITGQATTLEDLDALYPSGLDSMPVSLDSDIFVALEQPELAFFGTDFKLALFNGTNLDAEVDTVETELAQLRQSEIDRLVVMVTEGDETTEISAQLGYRDRQNDDLTFSSAVEQDSFGDIWFREPAARYHRARILLSGEWAKAQGVEFAGADGGDR